MTIKAKQVAGVTAIVGLVVVVVSALYLSWIVRVELAESDARANLVASAVVDRASEVVAEYTGSDLPGALRDDSGIQSALRLSGYAANVTFAAIVDSGDVVIAHSLDPAAVGRRLAPQGDLGALVQAGPVARLRAIYESGGRTLEVHQPLYINGQKFGAVRVGVSTLLIRADLHDALRPVLYAGAGALVAASLVAMLLSNLLLRPIHLIRSSLTRLGRGEFDVKVDAPQESELADLGASLQHVDMALNQSRRLAAIGRLSGGVAHEIKNPLNATAIHVELLRQQLDDARDLVDAQAADPPLRGRAADVPAILAAAADHLSVIHAELQRLDRVVQGFLRFTKQEELHLQPVRLAEVLEDVMPVITAEAGARRVDLRVSCPRDLPLVSADAGLLQQAFLNLALNACQAMPDGGTLRITGAPRGRLVELRFEDTGVGIAPENLGKVFDLYFTTKDEGSGMGLSLVYRTVQLHDAEIDVESTLGRGTTFRVFFKPA